MNLCKIAIMFLSIACTSFAIAVEPAVPITDEEKLNQWISSEIEKMKPEITNTGAEKEGTSTQEAWTYVLQYMDETQISITFHNLLDSTKGKRATEIKSFNLDIYKKPQNIQEEFSSATLNENIIALFDEFITSCHIPVDKSIPQYKDRNDKYSVLKTTLKTNLPKTSQSEKFSYKGAVKISPTENAYFIPLEDDFRYIDINQDIKDYNLDPSVMKLVKIIQDNKIPEQFVIDGAMGSKTLDALKTTEFPRCSLIGLGKFTFIPQLPDAQKLVIVFFGANTHSLTTKANKTLHLTTGRQQGSQQHAEMMIFQQYLDLLKTRIGKKEYKELYKEVTLDMVFVTDGTVNNTEMCAGCEGAFEKIKNNGPPVSVTSFQITKHKYED